MKPRLPILETERLSLTPLADADAASLFPLLRDAEAPGYWDLPEIDDPDLVAQAVSQRAADMDSGAAVHWAVRPLGGGDLFGCCDLADIDRRHKRAEISFILDAGTWGQGYALEAMRAVVAYAAGSGLRKLTARTHLGERRAERVLEKLGFEEEGLLRGHNLKDGERRDLRLFGLLL